MTRADLRQSETFAVAVDGARRREHIAPHPLLARRRRPGAWRRRRSRFGSGPARARRTGRSRSPRGRPPRRSTPAGSDRIRGRRRAPSGASRRTAFVLARACLRSTSGRRPSRGGRARAAWAREPTRYNRRRRRRAHASQRRHYHERGILDQGCAHESARHVSRGYLKGLAVRARVRCRRLGRERLYGRSRRRVSRAHLRRRRQATVGARGQEPREARERARGRSRSSTRARGTSASSWGTARIAPPSTPSPATRASSCRRWVHTPFTELSSSLRASTRSPTTAISPESRSSSAR